MNSRAQPDVITKWWRKMEIHIVRRGDENPWEKKKFMQRHQTANEQDAQIQYIGRECHPSILFLLRAASRPR